MTIRKRIAESYPDEALLFMSGTEFDAAILGVASRIGLERAVCYDARKVIEILAQTSGGGMSIEDAEKFFHFNIADAYVGPHTPVFVETGYGNAT